MPLLHFQHRLLLTVLLFTFTLSTGDGGEWQIVPTKNKIPNRGECGMAAANGKLYLLGGGKLPTELYDPITLTWTEKKSCPININHFQAVADGKNIYVLAAFTEGVYPDQPNLGQVYVYNTDNDTWSKGGALSPDRQRAAAGAARYNGKLYLVAGIQHGHSSGTCRMFDEYDPLTKKWTLLPDAPHIRDHCSAAVINHKLYVAGGRNTSYHEPQNFMSFFSKTVLEVDCYDFKTGLWSTLAEKLPLGSGGGALVNLQAKLYYMGGERATDTEANKPRDNVYCLDPAGHTPWKEISPLKEARNGLSAAVLGDAIYVFGGAGAKIPPLPDGPLNDSTKRPPPPPPHGPEAVSPLEMFQLN